jgi:hypothetical protein
MIRETWNDWRRQVVAVIRYEMHEVLPDVQEDDVDWDAWRVLFDRGRSPRQAFDEAFLRDRAATAA